MELAIDRKTKKLIEEQIRLGHYENPEAVVRAAVISFSAQQAYDDFAPGELNKLIEEGERSIRKYGTVDADTSFRRRREKREKRMKSRSKAK